MTAELVAQAGSSQPLGAHGACNEASTPSASPNHRAEICKRSRKKRKAAESDIVVCAGTLHHLVDLVGAQVQELTTAVGSLTALVLEATERTVRRRVGGDDANSNDLTANEGSRDASLGEAAEGATAAEEGVETEREAEERMATERAKEKAAAEKAAAETAAAEAAAAEKAAAEKAAAEKAAAEKAAAEKAAAEKAAAEKAAAETAAAEAAAAEKAAAEKAAAEMAAAEAAAAEKAAAEKAAAEKAAAEKAAENGGHGPSSGEAGEAKSSTKRTAKQTVDLIKKELDLNATMPINASVATALESLGIRSRGNLAKNIEAISSELGLEQE